MRKRGPSTRAIGALVLLCLLLAAAVELELRYPEAFVRDMRAPDPGAPIETDIEVDGAAKADRYKPPGEDDFSVIEQRPLFSPDRRPPDADTGDATDDVATPASLDGLMLTGIIGAGEQRIAIVEPTGPPRPGTEALLLRVGDKLRGWTVKEIETDRILLVADTQRYYMMLIDESKRRRPRNPLQPRAQRAPNQTPLQPKQTPQQLQIQPQPQQPQGNR